MRSRLALVVAVVVAVGVGASSPAIAQAPKPPPPAPVTVSCEFLEIMASSAKDPSVDADLEKLKKKLKKPPFSSWNVFKLAHREQKSLEQKKTEKITLKQGHVEAKLHGIVNKSQVRLSISLDVGGKNIVNTTATVEGGDYLVYGHTLADNIGHMLAVTCK